MHSHWRVLQKQQGQAYLRTQEVYESRGGRPGLPVPNSPYGFCGRAATLNLNWSDTLCRFQGFIELLIKPYEVSQTLSSTKTGQTFVSRLGVRQLAWAVGW